MPTTTGIATSFIDFTRASNATVTDSDGKVKWAPHNLLTNSESFDAAAWSKTSVTPTANSIAAPNGTTTADTLAASGANGTTLQTFTAEAISYTFSVWLRRKTGTGTIEIAADSGTYTAVTITSSWALYTVTQTPAAGSKSAGIRIVTSGDEVYAWGAHLYRSDLGGMQANTSAYPMYNPTTPKNLLGYTEDWSNAAWVKMASTVTANTILAPNGLQTADKIVATNSASATRGSYQNFTPVSGGRYVLSIYAKAAEYDNLALQEIGGGRFGASFNLTAQTATSLGGAGYVSSNIVSVGDGWFRCSVVWTGGGGAALTVSTFPAGATVSAGGTSYAGDGTSGIYLWGAQLSDSASLDPYVPVYGAAVTSAAYYGPRRDFDPVTLACKGLLVEEQRTNIALYSEAFDDAYWARSNAPTVTANTVVGPSGTQTADTITGGGGAFSGVYRHIASTNGLTYISSVYVKSGTSPFVAILVNNGSGGAWFNLNTGAKGSVSGTVAGYDIVPVGGGWYRVWVSVVASGTLNATLWIAPTSADNVNNGTGSVYAWGAQVEQASFATSYIPTGAATATRNADVASVSTQAFPYSQTEGTLVVSGDSFSATRDGKFLSITDGTASGENNCFTLDVIPSSKTRFLAVASGLTQANFTSTASYTSNSIVKIAGAYKQNDFGGTTNGEAITTDTTGNVPAVSVMEIGFHRSGSPLQWINGHIRQITYIPRRLSNAELQARTV